MDENKQTNSNIHSVGAMVHPSPTVSMPAQDSAVPPFAFDDNFAADFVAGKTHEKTEGSPDTDASPALAEAPPENGDVPHGKPSPVMSGGSGSGPSKKTLLLGGAAVLTAGLLVVGGLLLGKRSHTVQMITDTTKVDKTALDVDTSNKSVGVGIPTGTTPDGLQVGSTTTAKQQGIPNIHMGLVNGTDPSIFFEDNQKNSWQILGVGGSLQLIQGDQTRAKLDANALSLTNALNVGGDTNANGNLNVKNNTTLGSSGNSLLTIQAGAVAIPNNLNFNKNNLVIEANKGNVAIGAPTASGFKLLVAGSFKASSAIYTDGQVLAGAGSAKGPSYTFGNNSNSGFYQPSINTVGVAAGGSQILQIQQGTVYTVNGTNFEADGYLRAGRGASNPLFQVARFTGTLDGSGGATISDGITNSNTRVLTIQAFYRGNVNESTPLNIDAVNGSNFLISGGAAGRQFRATIIYSQDNSGW
jgi:hypothetical protein